MLSRRVIPQIQVLPTHDCPLQHSWVHSGLTPKPKVPRCQCRKEKTQNGVDTRNKKGELAMAFPPILTEGKASGAFFTAIIRTADLAT